MTNIEYAIRSADVHGNWAVESKRYTSLQELANDYRARVDAMTSGKQPTDVFQPLARLTAGEWVELDGDHYQNTNALTIDTREKLPPRQDVMLINVEEYERLVSAAMAYAYQLHPAYNSPDTWHSGADEGKPTQGCSITDGPPWSRALHLAAKDTINAAVRDARAQGLLVDRLQTEHPEHNPHAHNPRPYSGPYARTA